MAIRLASAIGQQREPIGILGGVDDAINKTGDAIQADLDRKAAENAKKKDQEQKLKDAVLGSIDVTSLEDVHPDDRAEDINWKKEEYAKIAIASQDPNTSPSQLLQLQRNYIQGAQDREYLYKRDWKKAKDLAKANKEGYLTKDMDMFMAGQTDQQNTPAQISKSQEGGGIGVPTEEEALGSTQFTGTPYFKKPLEERLKTNIDEEYDKRVVMPTLGALESLKDISGKEFSPNDFVTRTVNEKGGWDYSVDKAKVENEAQKYAIHMVGNTNYGKRQNQTKTAMEKEAYIALRNAGLSDDEIVKEMPNVVKQLAYDDFMRKVQPAIDGELTRQKEEPLRKEGKGMTLNFTGGGGGSSKIWNIGDAVEAPLYEVKDGKKTDKVIGDYYYHSIQTAAAGENPKKFNIAGNTDVQVEGINVNKKTGKPEYVDITIPARYDKRDKVVKGTGIKKTVGITEDTEIENLRTNLGKDLYDKTIGAHKPTKAEAPSKGTVAATDDGTRPDGTKKGKGYFGELKMEDGSGKVASEISINFDDVLGGALIPSLVPTLTESEKKYLLKGNRATKEIQLKAIKHAEERASKGLSPFVDGGELKSKSGKPIYWDKTAKTYKYKYGR